jgi:hypothetical protein
VRHADRSYGAVRAGDAGPEQEHDMPRYLVERTFPGGLDIPMDGNGRQVVASVVANNADQGVTWVHSYVSDDTRKTFCIYDGPTPESIRNVAQCNSLPVDAITEVSVLDPYFYLGKGGGSRAS